MKKLNLFIIFSILSFFIALPSVKADNYYGVVNTAVLRVRSGPGKDYEQLAKLSIGTTRDLVSIIEYPDEGGCDGEPWYQIYYDGTKTGYVCSLYFDEYKRAENTDSTTPTTDCEKALAEKGFPSTYWSGLCALQSKHPNWNFNVLATGVDFNAAVSAESSCGKNLMNTSNSNYLNTSCSTTNYNGYKTITSGVVAYYLDPRNFFNDTHIFMFEDQYYNNNINDSNYTNTISKIYNNNFLIQQIPSLPNYILNAGKSSGMNPVAITSRIYQEMGNGKLTSGDYVGQLYSSLSGNYTTRYPNKLASDGHSLDHYYNFYNINAYDNSESMTYNALIYAYSKGWGGTGDQNADRQTAITGGATWIKNRYLEAGQKTAYLQKFNVNPKTSTSLYMNQYMTNIEAPKSEASTIYKAYSNLGILDSNFIFYIPIFENMPVSTSLPTSSNDKNYNGIGDEVKEEENITTKVSVSNIVSGAGYNYNDSYISKINTQTEVSTLINNLTNNGGTVTIYDADNKQVTSGILKTGYKVKISGSDEKTLDVVIYGDASGDGKINALDLLKVQKDILKSSSLTGVYKTAGDASKDGKVNALDLLKIQKQILGTANIEQ